MYLKIHRSYRPVVALCDKNLIGKKFEEGKRQLELRENFYKGEEVSEAKAVKILQFQSRDDATFNIVGEKATLAAIKAKIISNEFISCVQGIPFALTLL